MKRIAIALGALILMGFGALAYASIPAADGTIHSCYKTADPGQGIVFIVDSAASCPTGFTALNWNQTGPAGPAGAAGTNGVAGYQLATDGTAVPANGSSYFWSATALCPSGKKVLGGGGNIQLNVSNVLVLVNSTAAFGGTNQEGWSVTYQRIGNINVDTQVSVTAICANAS